MRELPNADEYKHVVKLLQLGSRMLIFVEIELLHFSELQNGSKVINLQPLISESIMEGPRPQGLPAPWFLSPACPNRADAERKQQKAIESVQKKQHVAAAQLRKREEKLAKAQKKAEEQLGLPSRWATLFER